MAALRAIVVLPLRYPVTCLVLSRLNTSLLLLTYRGEVIIGMLLLRMRMWTWMLHKRKDNRTHRIGSQPLGLPPSEERNLACITGVFSRDQKIRHQILINEVLSIIRDTKELSNGYQVEFPYDPSLFLKISEWMTLEHLCCPFFNFTLQLETDIIRLAITGSDEAKRFLQTWIGQGGNKRI